MLRWSLGMYFDDIVFEIVKLRTEGERDDGIGGGDDIWKDYDDSSARFEANPILGRTMFVVESKLETSPRITSSHAETSAILQYSASIPPIPSKRPTHIYIRWTLEGTPRPSLLFSSPSTPIRRSTYQGIFTYRFDRDGHIAEHRVERIVPAPSRRAVFLHGFGGWFWRLRAWWEQRRHREPELGGLVGYIRVRADGGKEKAIEKAEVDKIDR